MGLQGKHGRKQITTGNQLRIIGGIWRGRRVGFPNVLGLRPSSDRVRETLFNWLQWVVPGSHCLDLFAGSGVLGLEALSRGAAEAVFVEAEPGVAACIENNAARLGANNALIFNQRAEDFLEGAARQFEVVFLDPPFGRELIEPTLERLAHGGWLCPGAYIYIECEASVGELRLPTGMSFCRQRRAGQVVFALARWQVTEKRPTDQ